ncbi:MAG: hypothetical protein J7604_20185 [Sporocytophaga sp.]|uniref:hypothetical protein n=1 Tax=Sporocytophaga sp. TaxID=2231183 RepID=UPI001B10B450|nr:hypothetical protein [Sporocytophaga sp.]MBO9702541.1 hypothetical protein [Sporocytophaga sp.]
MKKSNCVIVLSLIACLPILLSCTKEETGPAKSVPSQLKQDDRSASVETNQIMLDVTDFIGYKIGKNESSYTLPCGILRVDSATVNSNNKKIYNLYYDDKITCNGKIRKGYVSIQLKKGNSYGEKDAECSITFKDFNVKIIDSEQTVSIIGTVIHTNLSGGYYWQAAQPLGTALYRDSVQTTLTGKLSVKHTNGEVREKSYSQKRTWKSIGGWIGMSMRLSGISEPVFKGSSVKNVIESSKTLIGYNDYVIFMKEDYLWKNYGESKAGPFVLVSGHSCIETDIKLALNSGPETIDIEAGYRYTGSEIPTPKRVKNSSSNAFKIYYPLSENIDEIIYQYY